MLQIKSRNATYENIRVLQHSLQFYLFRHELNAHNDRETERVTLHASPEGDPLQRLRVSGGYKNPVITLVAVSKQ